MEPNDFVIATRLINGIVINSVGIIKSICEKGIQVYFIGKNEVVIAPSGFLSLIDVAETGNKYPKKICTTCCILKPKAEFPPEPTDKSKTKTLPNCKSCLIEKELTSAEKKKMDQKKPLNRSIFKCPICERSTIVGITARIVRDHNHKTGMGRKWICQSCNTGLGAFKDDITILKNAIEYLTRFKNDESADLE